MSACNSEDLLREALYKKKSYFKVAILHPSFKLFVCYAFIF